MIKMNNSVGVFLGLINLINGCEREIYLEQNTNMNVEINSGKVKNKRRKTNRFKRFNI
jgi:hypothetical protein